MRLKINVLLFFLLLIANGLFAQMNDYNYSHLNDFRIYGTTKTDTIEIPYILEIGSEKQTDEKIDFTLINSSIKGGIYFFTFEIPSEQTINEIQLNFKQQNFNALVNLEGSQDNIEWFSIVEDYRILSIKNEQTEYQFSNIKFPKSKYRYVRFSIKSDIKLDLIAAETQISTFESPDFKTYKVENFSATEQKEYKKTILDIDFSQPLPISFLSFKIKDALDYYRPVTIKYLSDSIKTEKGWKYNFLALETGVLSSIENNEIYFKSTITKKLRVEIENFDNSPLNIEEVIAKGYTHKLIARFTETADYFMVYGNENANTPNYDISKFTAKIPTTISDAALSEEKAIDKKMVQKTSPLFENKLWLWLIMALIILLLGWFTIKMIKQK